MSAAKGSVCVGNAAQSTSSRESPCDLVQSPKKGAGLAGQAGPPLPDPAGGQAWAGAPWHPGSHGPRPPATNPPEQRTWGCRGGNTHHRGVPEWGGGSGPGRAWQEVELSTSVTSGYVTSQAGGRRPGCQLRAGRQVLEKGFTTVAAPGGTTKKWVSMVLVTHDLIER